MNNNQVATLARINGRLEAEGLLELRQFCGGAEYNEGFALALREFADSVLGKPETELRVMNDIQAAQFESTDILFGLHRGLSYGEVPILYLSWLADQGANLAAYLRSNRGQRRLREVPS
jgi:hypothetical protein